MNAILNTVFAFSMVTVLGTLINLGWGKLIEGTSFEKNSYLVILTRALFEAAYMVAACTYLQWSVQTTWLVAGAMFVWTIASPWLVYAVLTLCVKRPNFINK